MSHRILVAGFKHETHTFSRVPTDLAAYRARALYAGQEMVEAMRGTASEIAGFLEACDANGWTAVPAVFADATPGGKVTREAFDHVLDAILGAVRAAGGVDGMLLCLHGAMVCEHDDDGEGALLRALRAELGRALPIAATHDLHANVTDAFAGLVDILVSYRTYPHVDQHVVAGEAAELLRRTLAGEIRPRVSVARGALMAGIDHGRTTAPGPMTEMLDRAAALMRDDPKVLSTSVNAGFSHADTFDTGPSVVAVTDGAHASIGAALSGMMDAIWESRHRETVETVSVAAAMSRLGALASASAPVVIADFADNPGGGGYAESTGMLRALVEAGIAPAVAGVFHDAAVASQAHAAGLGATIDVCLGGKVDPELSPALPLRARVEALTDGRFRFSGPMLRGQPVDMGPSAVLEVNGLRIVVASKRFQCYDRMFFEHAGIDLGAQRVVMVKSAQHFRAAYQPLACEVLVVDSTEGLTTGDLKVFPYARVRRPIFPLDLD
ncbi:MAG: M81 family metallopeptidase [Chromatiales bacterium]|nr:M81 family metallopeptidase [Chromatiales bacterium]